jgi:hypothetical protein
MIKQQSDLCGALARHFRVKKAVFFEQAKNYLEEYGGEYPFIEFSVNGEALRTGATKRTIPFGKMLFFKNIKKDGFYEDVENFLGNDEVDFFCFLSGTALMIMRKDKGYTGEGGLYTYDNETHTGYVVEPIAHYLNSAFPVYIEE